MRLLRLSLSLVLTSLAVTVFADRYHTERSRLIDPRRPGPDSAEFTAKYWYDEAEAGIKARLSRLRHGSSGVARNVVMFLGDGMSVPTLAAARTLLGQRSDRPGEEEQLSFEAFPTIGLVKV